MTKQVSGVRCQVSGVRFVANASYRAARVARHPTPDTRQLFRHRGFTLVELLITITIIGILASLILGVASVAGETARHRHTEQIIARLHTLLMEHYDTYKTRRVSLRQQISDGIDRSTSQDYNTPAKKGMARAYGRLYALRELMLMEVPDRWSDILLNSVPDPPTGLTDSRLPFYQDLTGASIATRRTSLADVYLRRYAAIARRTNSITGQRNTAEEITDNQGAECLYLVITTATGDGEARSLFGENMIGDVDGDGAKEFLDGWDRPINFLRWAPGFDSQIQLNANRLGTPPTPTTPGSSSIWKSSSDTDHDPFDLFRVDTPSFRLVPLIFSGGGDETFGIHLQKRYVALQGLERPADLLTVPDPNNWRAIFPWAQATDPINSSKAYLGTDNGEGAATDNIHNHLLGDR